MYSVNLKIPRNKVNDVKSFTANMPTKQKKQVTSKELVKIMDDPKMIEVLKKLAAE